MTLKFKKKVKENRVRKCNGRSEKMRREFRWVCGGRKVGEDSWRRKTERRERRRMRRRGKKSMWLRDRAVGDKVKE